MKKQVDFVKGRWYSFGPALKGLRHFFASEANGKVHLLAVVLVTGLGFYLNVTTTEWLVLVILMGMVLVAELLNTAIELAMDRLIPERDDMVGKIKDIAAAAVLIASVAAAIGGVLIFGPYFW